MKVIAFVGLLAFSLSAVAESPNISFGSAKKKIYQQVYNNSGKTVYCGCDWSKKKVDLGSCGLQDSFPKKQRKRASRSEMEHIIAASWMLKKDGKFRQCVIEAKQLKESPRKYCQKHDMDYKRAHNDQVNLIPSVGQINADRSNKPFVDSVKSDAKTYGQCLTKIDSRGILPPFYIKGDIARIAFYMHDKYGVNYSKRQNDLFKAWDKKDPIDEYERMRNKRIIQVQGYGLYQ